MIKEEIGTPLAANMDDDYIDISPWGLFMARILGPREADHPAYPTAFTEDRWAVKKAA